MTKRLHSAEGELETSEQEIAQVMTEGIEQSSQEQNITLP